MSKVVAIIAEYNPFHNGHLYHIEETKRITGAESVICVMGGNFTQRGENSIVNKWDKTKMAILNGIDLVIELPTIYTVSSAENFASGAIKILNQLNIVDYVSFGAETDNMEKLKKLARVFTNEPREYKKTVKQEMKKGNSYPKAREIAIKKYFGESDNSDYAEILNNPNNILAIEYLKALIKTNSKIEPVLVKRNGAKYNNREIEGELASATAIRESIAKGQFEKIKKVMPQKSFETIEKAEVVCKIEKFEKEIIYKLRQMSKKEIANLPDVAEGLENVIKKEAHETNSYWKLVENIKSKRYTMSRIQRILIYALLGITKKDMQDSKRVSPYVRILGMSEAGKKILARISRNKNNNIITSVKKFINSNKSKKLKRMMEIDILSTEIYTLECERKNVKPRMDFTMQIIK